MDSLDTDVMTHVNVRLRVVTRVLLAMYGSVPIN